MPMNSPPDRQNASAAEKVLEPTDQGSCLDSRRPSESRTSGLILQSRRSAKRSRGWGRAPGLRRNSGWAPFPFQNTGSFYLTIT